MALPCTNLNLNLYRVFYTVAKTKSFSESSRTLHISQPAISKHIQNLEYELKTLLFYRTNRGIELTKEAKDLLVYVEKSYNYLMLGERELQANQELNKGKITISSSAYISIYYLDKYLKKYIAIHPDTSIKILNNHHLNSQELLSQHNIDFLFSPLEIKDSKEYKSILIEQDEFCFAYNKKYDLKEITTLEELSKYPLLLPSSNTISRQNLNQILTTKNLNITPIVELEDNQILLDYIKEGIGIGYIEKSMIKDNPDLEIVPLEEELPKENIYLTYNETSLSSSGREFINMINTKATN